MFNKKISIADWGPSKLGRAIKALDEEYHFLCLDSDIKVSFVSNNDPSRNAIKWDGSNATVSFGQINGALRMLGGILSGVIEPGRDMLEQSPFPKLGVMLDCSRNAVMKVEHVKKWLRCVSLMGYNQFMLYTEDTYELPGEPYFGYQRGAYTAAELKEIDKFAVSLGIENIACIQTLGHLKHVLKWPAYASMKDTESVLMVDEPATYELIEKMLDHVVDRFQSRRIHIGMDEAHDLGRGRFLDKYGYQRGFDIFNRHLAKVCKLCENRGLSPMIWSDMYFRMGNPQGEYYCPETTIPEDVKNAIPSDVGLVYWDYYHDNKKFYLDWISRHRELGREPIVASAIWTWFRWWYDHKRTATNTVPCISACREAGISELIFTIWGDNGAYCELDSALAGLAFCAEHIFSCDEVDEKSLAKRFEGIVGASFENIVKCAAMNSDDAAYIDSVMWDDPILLTDYREKIKQNPDEPKEALALLEKVSSALFSVREVFSPVDFGYGYHVCELLKQRIRIAQKVLNGYVENDTDMLMAALSDIPEVIKGIDEFLGALRRQWCSRNKIVGLHDIQQRIGGIRIRYVELQVILRDYLNNAISVIPELK